MSDGIEEVVELQIKCFNPLHCSVETCVLTARSRGSGFEAVLEL